MFKSYILHIFFLLILSFIGRCQTSYIIDSSYFKKISKFYFLNNDFIRNNYEYADTSILNFQNSLPFYFNGRIGTAQSDYLFEQRDYEIGSRVLPKNFPDLLDKNKFTLYRTKGFYSKIEGIAGSKDEQHFKVYFTSPVKHEQQINFYFRRSTNTGFYLNQKASITNLLADYHWFGKRKISMDASVVLNYIKHQENGGILKDTLSYSELFLDKTLIPVALTDARKNLQSHHFKYQFNYLIQKDSVSTQSVSFSPSFNYLIYQYQDNYPLSGYYPFIFLDTLKTNDSLNSLKLDLPISYSLRYKKSIIQISYNYQWNRIYLFSDTSIVNHFFNLTFESSFNMFRKLRSKWGQEINYVFLGTQKDNYLINLFLQTEIKKFIFYCTIELTKQAPLYQQNYWYSNHFIWYNRFKDIVTQHFSWSINHQKGIKLKYNFYFIENFIYYFNNYPQAYNSILNIHQVNINLDKVFFRHIGINANYYYQWKSANVVILPEHFLKADVYYQGRWFHKNLLVNTGIQYISPFSYFDTYQYNPATGNYSIQYQTIQAGQYPQINIYFSGRIKPVNFFIRMDNLLSGIYSKPYYFVSHYMMPDRAFRMGINWMFFD